MTRDIKQNPLAHFTVRMPYDLYERLWGYADDEGIPIASVIKAAVEKYLAEQEGKPR